jgi:hypothetical protein
MPLIAQMLAGAIGGVLSAAVIAMLPARNRGASLATFLGVAAGIYVGFGLQDGRPRFAFAEFLAGVPFVAAALWWPHAIHVLAVAWLAHGVVDGLHLAGFVGTRVPDWYPGACLGLDVVLGLAALRWANALGRRDTRDVPTPRVE